MIIFGFELNAVIGSCWPLRPRRRRFFYGFSSPSAFFVLNARPFDITA
jgi:hypothetical protein